MKVLEYPDVTDKQVTIGWLDRTMVQEMSDEELVKLCAARDPDIIIEEVEDCEEISVPGRCVSPVAVPEDVKAVLQFEIDELREKRAVTAKAVQKPPSEFGREVLEVELANLDAEITQKERHLKEEIIPRWLAQGVAEVVEHSGDVCCAGYRKKVKVLYLGSAEMKVAVLRELTSAPEFNMSVEEVEKSLLAHSE